MNKNACAPGMYDDANNTCFSLEQLVELAGAYNRYITKMSLSPKNMSKNNRTAIKSITIKKDKKYLLNELRNRFESVCHGSDVCMTKQMFMNEIVHKEYIIESALRPEGPGKRKEWLVTRDITAILDQYESIYPNFKFIGTVPSDCSILDYCPLFNFDFQSKLDEGITRLGIVFNHDTHDEDGSHWVSMFIDLKKKELYFCDSAGGNPVGKINQVIKDFKKWAGPNSVYKKNIKKYQKDKSECGVYSCNFIIRLLGGESFEDVVNNPLRFEEINSCRNKYFSNTPLGKNTKPNKLCDPKF
jgi:hypothetical protein